MSEDRRALIHRKSIYEGRVVRLSLDTVRFPNGSTGELELIRHRGAAAVLPVLGTDAKGDPEILLILQYRYAAGGKIYEIPAGIVEENESWEECAHRELEEETGYKAGKLVKLTTIYTTPGFTNECIHLFAAFELSRGSSRLDADEFLQVEVMPLTRALQMAATGEIMDAKSLVALLHAERFLMGSGG